MRIKWEAAKSVSAIAYVDTSIEDGASTILPAFSTLVSNIGKKLNERKDKVDKILF